MTTANVLTQALQLVSISSRESGFSRAQAAAGTGFGQVMSDSLRGQSMENPSDTAAVKQNSTPAKPLKTAKTSDKAEAPTEELRPEETTDRLSAETAASVEEEVKELVQEELGLTEEELEAAMTALGMEYLDLLLPENMKTLLLEIKQVEAVELLTREELNVQLAALLEGTEEILSAEGLEPLPEELPGLLEELKKAGAEPALLASEPTEAEKAQTGPELLIEKADGREVEKPEAEASEKPEEAVTPEKAAVTSKTEEGAESGETKNEFQGSGKQQEEGSELSGRAEKTPMEAILQNLSSHTSVEEVAATAAQRMETMREIVNQVLEQIRITIKPDTTSMELTLNPENLGKINLTVVSKEGHLTASFTTQNQVTKEALESQMQTLKETLTNQGLKVDAIEINIESFAFDERNQMSGGQGSQEQSRPKEKRLSVEELSRVFGEEADTEEELPDTASITQSGSRIDYTA